jgi:hypothetical protein
MSLSRPLAPVLAAPLLALTPLTQPPLATAQTYNDPSAGAQAMIDSQKAGAAFRALPNPNARLVMHIQSGMPCIIANGMEGVLKLNAPDGKDVTCDQVQPNGVTVSMSAMFTPDMKVDDAFAAQVKTVMSWRWTKLPEGLQPSGKVKEPTAAYNIGKTGMVGDLNGVPTMVRIAGFKTPDGWIIMERFVSPVAAGGPDEGKSISRGFAMADEVIFATAEYMSNERAPQATSSPSPRP